jgi:hypothetical protein
MNKVCFTFEFNYDIKKLANIVYNIGNWDSYIPPRWDETKYTIDNFTGVTYRYYADLQNKEPIKTIRKSLNFPYLDYTTTQLLKFPPYNGPTIHRDTERYTAVIFPIYTNEVYEPIKFYHNDKSEWFDIDYTGKVIVFDAKVLHAVCNKEYNRYSLQFDLKESYKEVYKKYCNGEFFA